MTDDKRHPLKSLLVTQFFGAFHDNAWKLIVTFLAIRALRSRFVGSQAGVEQQVFSVTAVADDHKRESLVVIHIHEEETIPEILKKLSDMGLPDLFIPRKDQFLKVDELPLLGSGKINLKEAKRIATEHFQ